MTAVDRMSDGYEPRFDLDYQVGQQGEMYVAQIADAIASGSATIEVKTDERASTTGRIFVEYECLHYGTWRKSGIASTEADLWAYVVGKDTVLVVPTWRLREVVRRVFHEQPNLRSQCVRGSHPTKGVLVPLADIFGRLFRVAS